MTTTATRENCNIEFREFVCLRFWLEFRCAPYGKRRPNPNRLNSLCVLSSVGWCDTVYCIHHTIIPHLSAHFGAYCEKWQKTKTTATKWKTKKQKKKQTKSRTNFFCCFSGFLGVGVAVQPPKKQPIFYFFYLFLIIEYYFYRKIIHKVEFRSFFGEHEHRQGYVDKTSRIYCVLGVVLVFVDKRWYCRHSLVSQPTRQNNIFLLFHSLHVKRRWIRCVWVCVAVSCKWIGSTLHQHTQVKSCLGADKMKRTPTTHSTHTHFCQFCMTWQANTLYWNE